MSKIRIPLAAMMATVAVSVAAAQDPIQWRIEDGGNGHWYKLTTDTGPTSWSDASAAAAAIGAHLVTITGQAENDWLVNTLGATTEHIGAFQDISADDYSEPSGGWRWVTEESWSYENWSGSGPDNNDLEGPEEELASFCCGGQWNDIYPTERAAAIEWSADCNSDGIIDYGQILNGELPDLNDDGIPDCCTSGLSCDCNSDGIIDYEQILNETIRDQDNNGIPDCCEIGAPCYVGTTYQVGPGSPGTIQALIDFVLMDGDTILLEQGTFFLNGPINTRGVEFALIGTPDPRTGEPLTILDGQGKYRVIRADDGGCYFESLTVQHSGRTALSGNFCELRNCVFLDNFSPDSPGAAEGRGLGFYNCEFLRNEGGWGGAAYTKVGQDGAAVVDCVFRDNRTTFGIGGALHAYSSVPILRCIFEGNFAAATGGALEARNSCVIEDCVFLSNSASGDGGGLLAYLTTTRNCFFSGNTSESSGGGGYFVECQVEDTEFVGNSAPKGGGMACAAIQGVGLVVRSNSASCNGGGVWNTGVGGLSLTACIISENDSGCGGGGIYSAGDDLMLVSCNLTQNSAEHGGAVYCDVAKGSGEVLITGTAITENNATQAGGGLFIERGRAAQLVDSTVCANLPEQIAGQWAGDPSSEVCGDGPCLGDINLDGQVDSTDLGLVLALWGTDSALVDINADGIVNAADLGLLIGAWGLCP